MFWKKKEKIDSEEFIQLRQEINKVRVSVASLQIDLELYVRKLKASKGLGKKEEEQEDIKNRVLLPE